MIKSIKAENYKSIKSLELELGRVNVFIGENGAGKSNILEVFALAGAAVADKLDNEFLASRGIRVTTPEFMQSAFVKTLSLQAISLSVYDDSGDYFTAKLYNDNLPYSKWMCELDNVWGGGILHYILEKELRIEQESNQKLMEFSRDNQKNYYEGNLENKVVELKFEEGSHMTYMLRLITEMLEGRKSRYIKGFVIFSPENTALKIFQREGQIEPLGINGEGLLKLLSVLEKNEPETLQEIKLSLQVLGWFEDFKLVDGDTFSPSRIAIKDRYIEDTKRYFDQMSANEGFLFLLFYFALFSTKLTPSIFAIDNIDASLNPALCEKLVRELVKLAKKHDKQVLLTTHNPATLDGLNLDDDEQRLFVVSRGKAGETKVKRLNGSEGAQDARRPPRSRRAGCFGGVHGVSVGGAEA